VNKESRFVRMCPCDTGNHQWGGLAWNRNVALWALNKSILSTIIDYGLESPCPSRCIMPSHFWSQDTT